MGEAEMIEQAHRDMRGGNLPAAEAICARILATTPNVGEALNLRAMIAQKRGDLPLAVGLYQKAIAARPDAAGYRNNLGVALHAMGRIGQAAEAYRQGAALNPKSAQILYNLGNTLRELGQLDDAATALREAIRLRGDVADFHYALGLVLGAAEHFAAAADVYRAAVAIRADHVDAWMNLGNALRSLRDFDAALDAQRKAVGLRSAYAEAHNNLALTLYEIGELEASIVEFQQAATLRPDFASAWSNLANVQREAGRLDEAARNYRRAISIQIDHADARKNLSLTLLQRGDYANGFLEYEWRFRVPGALVRRFDKPRWTGEDPAGRTLFIHEEQGFGDVIQFARYAAVLARRGARVIFGCRPQLTRLIAACDGVDTVVTGGQTIPPFDLHCSLMSLPLFCRTQTVADVPANVPYFRLPDEITRPWKERLGPSARPRVGLCWAGNPELASNRFRSISLERFLSLAGVGDIEWHSLQIGPAAADRLRVPGLPLIDHAAEIRDFADTAALIECLDLVIAVDTAVAHLAGALGKALWLLVPASPDWRWLMDRRDSPWYPTARLFRAKGDWGEIIGDMGTELAAWAAGR